jgi:NTE family protein
VLATNSFLAQQKVGLVLSGGGATGFAHIGVLQALEEKGIPIDYITGTSAGALVGAFYAAGFSPLEIREFCKNEDFLKMATGELRPEQQFFIKEDDPKSDMVSFRFAIDSLIQKSLPTNFTNSTFLDFELMKILGTVGAAKGNDFDNLFVPFRCLASDIVSKENVVFKSGHLNEAVRASMTFPFYFQPLRINGRLLFDGGLYNNFPADILYKEFSPDYIIGSNVSYNAAAPKEYDLISQLENMLVRYSNFELPCEQGIIIEPELEVGTFDLTKVESAIEIGYITGLKYADSILPYIKELRLPSELATKRKAFREFIPALVIDSIHSDSDKKINYFVNNSMLRLRKKHSLSASAIERRYYRLAATDHIGFIFPTIDTNSSGNYNMNLTLREKNHFKLDVGGLISSRPINTGYLGLTYYHLKKRALKIHAESYFGKFYGSINTNAKIEFPAHFPVTIEPYFTMNRWDYFKSFATFFEDVKPSFLVQNETYYGLKISHPLFNNSKSTYDVRMFHLEDDYYQTEKFSAQDTSDRTFFDGETYSWKIEQNSLNRKQFASSGHYLSFKARFIHGNEKTISGSTSFQPDQNKNHEWINLNLDFQTFPISTKYFHVGFQGKATFNSQSLFGNYTASLLSMTAFNIIPDSYTYFLPEYRSPQFFGGGINLIFSLPKNVDVRLDGFYYQPLVQLIQNDTGGFGYSKPFKGESYLASVSAIYHSPIGPLRATLNYFSKQVSSPLNFQISFGYILFNERAIR